MIITTILTIIITVIIIIIKGKALHGEFVQQTSDVAVEDSWRWFRNDVLE